MLGVSLFVFLFDRCVRCVSDLQCYKDCFVEECLQMFDLVKVHASEGKRSFCSL